MADWRQIQARIRKAKNAADPPAKLSELFQRTRDAMVAWELGAIEEKAARTGEAIRWYTIAVQRFRRADWKKRAEEALARLGADVPPPGAHAAPEPPAAAPPIEEPAMMPAPAEATEPEEEPAPAQQFAPPAAPGDKRKRRRGRRGGRGRRRRGAPAPALPSRAFAEPSASTPRAQPAPPEAPESAPAEAAEPPRHVRAPVEPPAPMLPSERTAHGRAGDPALASRLVQLESKLRRLVSSPLHKLDESDEAPAGPGVFLLSDSDQITSYYVEACQTLRVGLGNLVRGGRGAKGPRGGHARGDSGLKAKLAEHLGINESKVSQYLKDHCVVRWLQLDDDAPLLAHFAIAILRTPLNME